MFTVSFKKCYLLCMYFLLHWGLHCCTQVFSRCDAWASCCSGFSWSQLRRLESTGPVAAAWETSCSEACGLFPRPGIEPMFLDWQVVSWPLGHQESSYCFVLFRKEEKERGTRLESSKDHQHFRKRKQLEERNEKYFLIT